MVTEYAALWDRAVEKEQKLQRARGMLRKARSALRGTRAKNRQLRSLLELTMHWGLEMVELEHYSNLLEMYCIHLRIWSEDRHDLKQRVRVAEASIRDHSCEETAAGALDAQEDAERQLIATREENMEFRSLTHAAHDALKGTIGADAARFDGPAAGIGKLKERIAALEKAARSVTSTWKGPGARNHGKAIGRLNNVLAFRDPYSSKGKGR